MAFFGLKLGVDLEMRGAHPHQKFQGVPPGAASKHGDWRGNETLLYLVHVSKDHPVELELLRQKVC